MLVYLINILLIMVWALVFRIGKRTVLKKILYVCICFIQLYLISAVREGVGSDFDMYTSGFFSMVVDTSRFGFFESLSYKDWEIGYIFICKLIGLFTADYKIFIMIISIFPLIGPAYLIARYSKNAFVSMFLYVNLYLFYMDMNFIRQAIAMSIMCFAYSFIVEKKFWRFLLVTVIAALFHLTVLYMIPVFIMCILKVNTRKLLLYLFGLLFYYILSDGLLNIVLSKFHMEYSNSVFIENGVYVRYAFYPLLICAAMVLLSYYLKNITPQMNVLIHMTLLMGFWQIVMTKHALFERFSYYTMLFVVIAVPEAIREFTLQYRENLTAQYSEKYHGAEEDKTRRVKAKVNAKANKAVAIITTAVLVLAFAYNMMGLIIPEKGVHNVLPYQTSYGWDIPSIDGLFKSGNSV